MGKVEEVLVTECKNNKLIGETIGGKAVIFNGEASLVGQFVSVEITNHKNSKLYGVIK